MRQLVSLSDDNSGPNNHDGQSALPMLFHQMVLGVDLRSSVPIPQLRLWICSSGLVPAASGAQLEGGNRAGVDQPTDAAFEAHLSDVSRCADDGPFVFVPGEASASRKIIHDRSAIDGATHGFDVGYVALEIRDSVGLTFPGSPRKHFHVTTLLDELRHQRGSDESSPSDD